MTAPEPIDVRQPPPDLASLADQIRQAGEPTPGRPTLVKLTGATEHQVRRALAIVRQDSTSVAPHAVPDRQPVEPLETAGEPLENQTASAGDESPTPPPADHQPTTSGHHAPPVNRQRPLRTWPLAFIGLAAAVAIWGGWVNLGQLTGFGPVDLLPGIGRGWTVNTAVVLPVSVEFYAAWALRVLLAGVQLQPDTRRFAAWSVVASLATGMGAQIASHIMVTAKLASAPDWVTTLVSCVPVLVVGLAATLAALVKRDANGFASPPARVASWRRGRQSTSSLSASRWTHRQPTTGDTP